MGLPPDAGTIACHELTHYVHFQQVAGFSSPSTTSSASSTRRSSGSTAGSTKGWRSTTRRRCSPGSGGWPGRSGTAPSPPAWLAGGCMGAISPNSTATPSPWATTTWSAATSSAFWPERYGEWRLWKTIEVQARSILFPLGVNVRFWQAVRQGAGDALRRVRRRTARGATRPWRDRPSSGSSRRWARWPATGAPPTAARR